MPRTSADIQSELATAKGHLAGCTANMNRATKMVQKLEQQLTLAKAREKGLAAGVKYRAIPIDRPGPILEGTLRKVITSHWHTEKAIVLLRVPAEGRFKERVEHLQIDQYEFERVNARKEVT